MKLALSLLSVVAMLTVASSLIAGEQAVNLAVGDQAPEFQAPDDQGKPWKSSDHVGKKILVVYFYPADMTGGCTAQACAFRDDMKKLEAAGVEVVGVSGDSVKNHQLFKKAENLNFTLLADPEGKVAQAFGVPFRKGEASIEREIDGETHTLTRGGTASRWTFVIGPDGNIAHKDTRVKAANDSKTVIQVVKNLKAE
ncbi:MAG: peroxiredoxin [Planctomycetaceae bacterium]